MSGLLGSSLYLWMHGKYVLAHEWEQTFALRGPHAKGAYLCSLQRALAGGSDTAIMPEQAQREMLRLSRESDIRLKACSGAELFVICKKPKAILVDIVPVFILSHAMLPGWLVSETFDDLADGQL